MPMRDKETKKQRNKHVTEQRLPPTTAGHGSGRGGGVGETCQKQPPDTQEDSPAGLEQRQLRAEATVARPYSKAKGNFF